MSRAAVFIDRDGTIIEEKVYLSDPAGVSLTPGAVRGLEELREAGFPLVVVTNQSGIARGYYTEADYRAVAARLNTFNRLCGAHAEPAPVARRSNWECWPVRW